MHQLLPYIIGVATAISSRVLLGEHSLPESIQNKLNPVADSLGDVADFFGNIRADNLSHWAKLGEHGLRTAINSDCYEDLSDWMMDRGYASIPFREFFAYLPALKKGEVEKEEPYIYPGSNKLPNVYQVRLGDAYFYVTTSSSVDYESALKRIETVNAEKLSLGIYLPEDEEEAKKVRKAIAEAFWEESGSLAELEVESNQLFLFDSSNVAPPYFGPLWICPERWSGERVEGKTTGVLVKGKSGNGKTTFAQHAAFRLKEPDGVARCLSLDQESLAVLNSKRWIEVCKLLEPTTVILEGVVLKKLPMALKKVLFSRRYRCVPFTFVTLADEEECNELYPQLLDEEVSVDEMTKEETVEFLRALVGHVRPGEDGAEVEEEVEQLIGELEKSSVANVMAKLRQRSRG